MKMVQQDGEEGPGVSHSLFMDPGMTEIGRENRDL